MQNETLFLKHIYALELTVQLTLQVCRSYLLTSWSVYFLCHQSMGEKNDFTSN